MPPAGFETAIPASERQQTHALDRAATGIGTSYFTQTYYRTVISVLKEMEEVLQEKTHT
jgi:hypothetical protein